MSTPVGIITFLFTDIEGSAAQWQASPAAMSTAVAAHDEITRRSVERHDGTVVKSTGDGAFGVFADPLQAVLAALELQRSWPNQNRKRAFRCAFAQASTSVRRRAAAMIISVTK